MLKCCSGALAFNEPPSENFTTQYLYGFWFRQRNILTRCRTCKNKICSPVNSFGNWPTKVLVVHSCRNRRRNHWCWTTSLCASVEVTAITESRGGLTHWTHNTASTSWDEQHNPWHIYGLVYTFQCSESYLCRNDTYLIVDQTHQSRLALEDCNHFHCSSLDQRTYELYHNIAH